MLIRWGFRQPILATQTIDPSEFTEVAGDDYQAPAAGMARDHEIIRSDDHAPPFQVGADVSERLILDFGVILTGRQQAMVNSVFNMPRRQIFHGWTRSAPGDRQGVAGESPVR
ncbi:MAG: hypothetical protein K0R37_2465 [Arthrobacter sp.]|nr:hypothetical protein [Arthrobacter sp.]